MNYTNGVLDIPICAVQWINFEVLKDYRNCTIGQIRLTNWREWKRHDKFNKESYISFNDLEPSRYALSFIPQPNQAAYFIEVAFVALDSEQLGEMVEDGYHHDFGDNKFPHYLGNKTSKPDYVDYDEEEQGEAAVNEAGRDTDSLSSEDLAALVKYIPKSVLLYLTE